MKGSLAIYNALKDSGIEFICSVPCANLKNLLNLIENDNSTFTHIKATREEEAFGICAGAHLAGKKTAILMQNSGIGNSINAIASLYKTFQIPTLLIISHRGDLKEKIPAQIPMGRWIEKLLDVCEIPTYKPKTPEEGYKLITYASDYMERISYPVALLFDALYWEFDQEK
ncbi:sulfopyruvate decarboxylase subunit ComD [Methanocaldococcus vulcanius M7]|uniref:Sulfopyruvate decarboxylase subunit alpha n=1 Tax=Methanocaldococcus vulcanius (strain ATCC 700851 / DSM 12094 / M7) TaxID=579137 RepID=C9RDJ5_METVM|nr:sulfopyruvate decarboxylase subunit alpha [Methanocaldococcus vulcanius]ACX73374.1 sulfopyruvate decarboxylase subunit ComD [Methanocaldococcus vulcanius M7]